MDSITTCEMVIIEEYKYRKPKVEEICTEEWYVPEVEDTTPPPEMVTVGLTSCGEGNCEMSQEYLDAHQQCTYILIPNMELRDIDGNGDYQYEFQERMYQGDTYCTSYADSNCNNGFDTTGQTLGKYCFEWYDEGIYDIPEWYTETGYYSIKQK